MHFSRVSGSFTVYFEQNMTNRIFSLFVLVHFFSQGITQTSSPYHLNWKKEVAVNGASLAGIGVSYLLDKHIQPFTPAQVANLQLSHVPPFDRFVTRQYSVQAQKASDILIYTSPIMPALLMADPAIRPHAGEALLMVEEAFILNTALTRLAKEIVHRPRPFNYNPDVPIDPKLSKDARFSFFSGHTSSTASLAFSSAFIWSAYHPNSRWKPLVWTGAAVYPAVVGWLRIKGGKHFLSDVLAGYAVGALTGWFIPYIHQKKSR
jgi:membrane-associated phospholipid phosphatase